MSFAIAFIADYAALLISALALCVSCRANSYAKAALAQSAKVKLLEVQAEVLREIDLQHAKLGSLLAITAEAALAYVQSKELRKRDPNGHTRIKQHIDAVQGLRSRYEEQREIAEQSLGQGSVEAQTGILANIRRLTLHVQEDIEKERRLLEQLQKLY